MSLVSVLVVARRVSRRVAGGRFVADSAVRITDKIREILTLAVV